MTEVRSFIDGQFVNPTVDAWFERVSPTTGEVVARVPDSDLLDVVRAVQASNKALALLQKQEPTTRRAEALANCTKIATAIEAASEEIARLQSEETGVPLTASRDSVSRAAAEFRYFAELVGESEKPGNGLSPAGTVQNRLPIGVVSLILPAYEPVYALARRLAPALASGNVVIAKASSFAPRTNDRIAKAVLASGLTSGVFNLLQGRGARIGRAIVEHPGLSTISFAGKSETGRLIQQGASELLKRTQLSLSGCSSVLVFDGGRADSELERVVKSVVTLSLSGLTPAHLRGARVFIQEPLYKRFLELMAVEAAKLTIGDPLDERTTLGPLLRAEEKTRYSTSVAQAVSERGKLLQFRAILGPPTEISATGALPARGNFVLPTVVYDVSLCSTLQQEEVLGPLAMVESFKYQLDAIKLVNNSPFGQIAYLFHADLEKASKIAVRLEAGRVVVNPTGEGSELSRPSLDESIGGLKSSGFGREGGQASLDFFSRQTAIEGTRLT